MSLNMLPRWLLLLAAMLLADAGQGRCLTQLPGLDPWLLPLDSARQVAAVQQALAAEGLYEGEVAGQLDDATLAAVQAYQKRQGLFADGRISEPLLALLLYQPTLAPDSLHAKSGQVRGGFAKAELDEPALLNQADAHGWTPLLYASLTGSPQRVAALLKAGADVDQASPYGTTPLMVAVRMNRSQVLVELFRHWPFLDTPDYQGDIAEEVAFLQERQGLLNQFRRQRDAMLKARLGRFPPFRLRMVTWDDQECYVARESRLPVDCDVQPDCLMPGHQVVLCADKGEKLQRQILDVVHKTWGGRPELIDGRGLTGEGPLSCRPDDVMLIGVRH